MPRVLGLDPGTVSIDLCGLEDGRPFVQRSLPTAEALADPAAFVASLEALGNFDLVAGPSGYGLPLVRAADATEADLALAFLAGPGERGGIGGLRALARALARSRLPVVYTPGVIHLPSVPPHRKLNRVDLGTAEKVCAAALGVADQRRRLGCPLDEVSFILLELGGAFTAGLAVDGGRIVDGLGGTSGPIGWEAAGALDGEVAFLAGTVTKALLFRGGVRTVAEAAAPEVALDAYLEGLLKAAGVLAISVPTAREILLSGRLAAEPGLEGALTELLGELAPVRRLGGFVEGVKAGAQGAALVADGLAGGAYRDIVRQMQIDQASGSVLDHLHLIAPADARRRLGLEG
ncbi:MAG TPA: DUF1464 family protein [Gemmatimonadales bacterium]|nr:DUF1464 family protein [Gemmatimonadales bacterium]